MTFKSIRTTIQISKHGPWGLYELALALTLGSSPTLVPFIHLDPAILTFHFVAQTRYTILSLFVSQSLCIFLVLPEMLLIQRWASLNSSFYLCIIYTGLLNTPFENSSLFIFNVQLFVWLFLQEFISTQHCILQFLFIWILSVSFTRSFTKSRILSLLVIVIFRVRKQCLEYTTAIKNKLEMNNLSTWMNEL